MRHDLLNVKVRSQHTVPTTVIAIILWVQFENYLGLLFLLETYLLIHKSLDGELIDAQVLQVIPIMLQFYYCYLFYVQHLWELHCASFHRHSDIPKLRVIVKHTPWNGISSQKRKVILFIYPYNPCIGVGVNLRRECTSTGKFFIFLLLFKKEFILWA